MLRQGGYDATQHRAGHSHFTPKIGKPDLSIVLNNRKTEICRNWQRGRCIYGASKCAFAHGKHELKHQSLNEMEHTGRIPNAAKFRCYPCLTWVATGSCPYFARCVFIHDPRIRGPNDAYIYKSNQRKSRMGKGGGGSGSGGGGGAGSPFGRDFFYWPDMARTDADGNVLPSISVNYEMDPRMVESPHATERAVYQLWYSLVGTIQEISEEPRMIAAEPVADPEPDPRDAFFNAPPTAEASRVERRGDTDTATRSTPTTSPPQQQAWRTTKAAGPAGRPPVFQHLSRGASIAPAYVPVPTTTGPQTIWKDPCNHCELVDRTLEGATAHEMYPDLPRPRRRRSSSSSNIQQQQQQSSFPLADIGAAAGSASSLEAHSQARRMRKERAWGLDVMMGEENEKPSMSDSQSKVLRTRRSTAPPALGRASNFVTRAAGSKMAGGLFDNRQHDATTVPHYTKAHRGFGTTLREGQNNTTHDSSWEEVVLRSTTTALPPQLGKGGTSTASRPSPSLSSSLNAVAMAKPLPTPRFAPRPCSHATSYGSAPMISSPLPPAAIQPSTRPAEQADYFPACDSSSEASSAAGNETTLPWYPSPNASTTTTAAAAATPTPKEAPGLVGWTGPATNFSPSPSPSLSLLPSGGVSRYYSPSDGAASGARNGGVVLEPPQAFHTQTLAYRTCDESGRRKISGGGGIGGDGIGGDGIGGGGIGGGGIGGGGIGGGGIGSGGIGGGGIGGGGIGGGEAGRTTLLQSTTTYPFRSFAEGM